MRPLSPDRRGRHGFRGGDRRPLRARGILAVAALGALLPALAGPAPLAAQQDAAVEMRRIRDLFARGRFDDVLARLGALLASADPADRELTVEAYALQARTYLALDRPAAADSAAAALVAVAPSYVPDRDATRPFTRAVRAAQRALAATQTTTVSKTPEDARAAPATVIFLTDEDLRRRGYTDLEQVLHDLPAFDISRGRGTLYSNVYQRGYRSNGTDRMLFLIDGVEENNIWAFNAYISRQYPLSNVRRVEVVYGPASTMYGANAFLGVVNVITKDPRDMVREGRSFGVDAESGVGSFGTGYADVTVAGAGDRVSYALTGRLFRSDEPDLTGFPEWDFLPPALDHYRALYGDEALAMRARDLDRQALARAPSPSGQPFDNATRDWLVSGRVRVDDFSFGFQSWKREEGSVGWFRDDYRGSARWIPRQSFVYARYDHQVSSRLSFASSTTFKLHDLDDRNRTLKLGDYASGAMTVEQLQAGVVPEWRTEFLDQESRQFRTEVTAIARPRDDVDVVGGVEFRSSSIQGDFDRSAEPPAGETAPPVTIDGGNTFDSRDVGVYVQGTARPAAGLRLTGGIRLDDNRIRSTGGYGSVVNARLAAVWTRGPWLLKGIFGQAFKDADNRSKFAISPGSRDLDNPNLRPERVDNVEATAGYRSPAASVTATWYAAAYSDAVAVQRVPYEGGFTGQNRNVGELRISGAQASLEVPWGAWRGWANYTYTRPFNSKPLDEEGRPRTDIDRVRIGDIASHRLNLGVDGSVTDRVDASLRLNWVGDRPTGPATTVPLNDAPGGGIEGYAVVHASTSWSPPDIPGLGGGLTAQVAVRNLLDARYFHPGVRSAGGEQASRLPQGGRSVMLRLLVRF